MNIRVIASLIIVFSLCDSSSAFSEEGELTYYPNELLMGTSLGQYDYYVYEKPPALSKERQIGQALLGNVIGIVGAMIPFALVDFNGENEGAIIITIGEVMLASLVGIEIYLLGNSYGIQLMGSSQDIKDSYKRAVLYEHLGAASAIAVGLIATSAAPDNKGVQTGAAILLPVLATGFGMYGYNSSREYQLNEDY